MTPALPLRAAVARPSAASCRPLRVLGSGVATAIDALPSSAIDARLGLPAGSVEKRSGVRTRRVETRRSAAELGADAARAALAHGGLDLSHVDAIVAASATMDQAMPCNAALIYCEPGLSERGIPAFDVGASCLGFLVALDTPSALIAAGRYRRMLVVAADIASCGLDWDHLESSAIFGDLQTEVRFRPAKKSSQGVRSLPPSNGSPAGSGEAAKARSTAVRDQPFLLLRGLSASWSDTRLR
ncbi:hypothetical protein [Tahibacter sp.]|uniref:hypothetical protein n=1 Tax=Tahibacter sp. TaxID=2056211 RepID=UPI0028C46F79|nr:hypothetical protein [Tahibacter sp.]